MSRTICEICMDLDHLNSESDLIYNLEKLTGEIKNHPDGNKALTALFKVLERFPEEDFGAPGSIVHTLEFYFQNGLEKELLNSLERKVTEVNLSMLNRLINRYRKLKGCGNQPMLNILIDKLNCIGLKESDEFIREQANYYLLD